jgi:hypothetical protein
MRRSLKFGGVATATAVVVVAALFTFGGSAGASGPKKHKPIPFSYTALDCATTGQGNRCNIVPAGDPNDSFAFSSLTVANRTANLVELRLDPEAINNPSPGCAGGAGAFVLDLIIPAFDTRSVSLTQPYIWQNPGPFSGCTWNHTQVDVELGTAGNTPGLTVSVVGQRLSL